MLRLQALLLALLFTINSFSQSDGHESHCEVISIEQLKELENFSGVITQLEREDRLTKANASAIKMFSSNGFVAFEQTPDSIIRQHGKITEDDIVLIVQVSEKENNDLIIITSYSGFGHAFKCDESLKKLERFRNNGKVIFSWVEKPEVKECSDSKITLTIKSPENVAEQWIKYYLLDLNKNILSGTKNCRIINNEEDCKEIRNVEFIRAYSTKSCPMPPFAEVVTEISELGVSIRSKLPPRHKMNESHLEAYDLWDTVPKYRKINRADFDSITNFILYSGLLNINLNYSKPKNDDGISMMISGGCGFSYVIETSEGEINLPIPSSGEFNVPDIVSEFSGLFYNILEKYFTKEEYEPDFYLFLKLRQK